MMTVGSGVMQNYRDTVRKLSENNTLLLKQNEDLRNTIDNTKTYHSKRRCELELEKKINEDLRKKISCLEKDISYYKIKCDNLLREIRDIKKDAWNI